MTFDPSGSGHRPSEPLLTSSIRQLRAFLCPIKTSSSQSTIAYRRRFAVGSVYVFAGVSYSSRDQSGSIDGFDAALEQCAQRGLLRAGHGG